MVQVSQRRDLEDPEVIQQFAREIRRPGDARPAHAAHLRRFDGHQRHASGTASRIRCSGSSGARPATLLGWQHRIHPGRTPPAASCCARRSATCLPKTFSDEEIDAHFSRAAAALFPDSQRPRPWPATSRWHTGSCTCSSPRTTGRWTRSSSGTIEPARGYTGLHICTWDRSGLFAKLTGALAAAGLNIMAAQIYTRADGIVLDDFFVTDARSGKLPAVAVRERFEKIALDVLVRDADPGRLLGTATGYPAAVPGGRRRIRSAPSSASTIPPRSPAPSSTSRPRTVWASSSPSRRSCSELGLDLALAKIVTGKGRGHRQLLRHRGRG
jgi:[protein-PII] uridylyltransferase